MFLFLGFADRAEIGAFVPAFQLPLQITPAFPGTCQDESDPGLVDDLCQSCALAGTVLLQPAINIVCGAEVMPGVVVRL